MLTIVAGKCVKNIKKRRECHIVTSSSSYPKQDLSECEKHVQVEVLYF